MAELKPCPVCGAKAFLNKDVVDGYSMGYSVGCPRYCVCDGIHGVNSHDVDESKHYAIFGFATKEEAIEAWNRRARMAKTMNDYPSPCDSCIKNDTKFCRGTKCEKWMIRYIYRQKQINGYVKREHPEMWEQKRQEAENGCN